MSLRHSEFFEANRGRIEALSQQVDGLIDRDDHSVFEVTNEDEGLMVDRVQGASSEDYLEALIDASGLPSDEEEDRAIEDAARELAEHTDLVNSRSAGIAVRSLWGSANKWRLMQQADAVDPDDQEAVAAFNGGSSPMLGFEKGRWEGSSEVGSNLETVKLARTQLLKLDHFGVARNRSITIGDGGVGQKASITHIGVEIPIISLVTYVEKDLTVRRAAKIMSETTMDRLVLMLGGRFQDEEELDGFLSYVWAEAQGTAHEEEITPILDEIRIQAMARKESIPFSVEHSLTLPSDDQFSRLEQVLANVE